MDRIEVYTLIDGERAYQERRSRIREFPYRDKDHSVADWLIYMEWHLEQAKSAIYGLNFPRALSEIRKITALGVACMEHNETPPRILNEESSP